MLNNFSPAEIERMPYVKFMARLKETNRPPGGSVAIEQFVQGCYIRPEKKVLDIGCNTGYVSFEIARLSGAEVIGVDIDSAMIDSAKDYLNQEVKELQEKITFQVADGKKLPFPDSTFDVVVCGGSFAFIEEKQEAMLEIKRVLKPWGFFGDVNFFYKIEPPDVLITKLNTLLGVTIEPWKCSFWTDQYKEAGFEIFSSKILNIDSVNSVDVEEYCDYMVSRIPDLNKDQKNIARNKLFLAMQLFNRNHEFMNYMVVINRKRNFPEEKILF